MAFRVLIKNKNFITGFSVGIILTFGSSYVAVVGNLVEFIFDNIATISPISRWGFFGDIIHAYLLTLFVYLIFSRLVNKKLIFNNFLKFSLGFASGYLLYLLIAVVAISQFRFTQ